jgi:hypothetical protein
LCLVGCFRAGLFRGGDAVHVGLDVLGDGRGLY